MLRHLCQELQRIKYLKIARQAFPEPLFPRRGKMQTLAFVGW
jgi:hypothetical protein